MNKKFIAAFIAVFLLLSCAASAFAVAGVSIGDFLQIASSIDTSKYTKFSEQEWTTMTPAERLEQFNYVVSDQKGTSKITENSDFINDSALSYKYYCGLINNSVINQGLTNNLSSKTYLEGHGLADFGLGFYNSNGHSSGKFGDGTVADTLNDDFLNYMRNVPYGSNTRYLFSNGYSISWEPVFFTNESTQMDINGVKHQAAYYRLRFLLYDASGVLCDTAYGGSIAGYGRFDDRVCLTCGIQPFSDLTITDDGYYFYSVSSGSFQHKFHDSPIPQKIKLPWYDKYGQPTAVSDDPLATGTDENGNQIQFNINSDGVTYEGSTYNYNDDNSVTINGNTYYITVNPKDVDEDYYKQFLQQVINNYYNYYNTDSTPFDDKDIISAVKSVFTSLETFRSYCYSQLKQLSDYVFDGFNSLRSSVSSLRSAVNNWGEKIVKAINSLGGASDLSDEELANYQKKLETAVNARFLPAIELKDLVEKALTAYRDNSISQISFDYNGRSYSIDFSMWFTSENLQAIRFLMAAFIYVSYAFNTYRRIPSYINNGGDK